MPLRLTQKGRSKKSRSNKYLVRNNLVRNRSAEKITKAAPKSIRDNPRKSTTAHIPQPIRMPKEIYIPPEKRQQIIDELRLL